MGEVEEGFWEFRAALLQGVKEKLILAHNSPTLEAASIMNFSTRPRGTETAPIQCPIRFQVLCRLLCHCVPELTSNVERIIDPIMRSCPASFNQFFTYIAQEAGT